jgi:hypothetical protein
LNSKKNADAAITETGAVYNEFESYRGDLSDVFDGLWIQPSVHDDHGLNWQMLSQNMGNRVIVDLVSCWPLEMACAFPVSSRR